MRLDCAILSDKTTISRYLVTAKIKVHSIKNTTASLTPFLLLLKCRGQDENCRVQRLEFREANLTTPWYLKGKGFLLHLSSQPQRSSLLPTFPQLWQSPHFSVGWSHSPNKRRVLFDRQETELWTFMKGTKMLISCTYPGASNRGAGKENKTRILPLEWKPAVRLAQLLSNHQWSVQCKRFAVNLFNNLNTWYIRSDFSCWKADAPSWAYRTEQLERSSYPIFFFFSGTFKLGVTPNPSIIHSHRLQVPRKPRYAAVSPASAVSPLHSGAGACTKRAQSCPAAPRASVLCAGSPPASCMQHNGLAARTYLALSLVKSCASLNCLCSTCFFLHTRCLQYAAVEQFAVN